MINFTIDPKIEIFVCGVDQPVPYPVTCAHQIHQDHIFHVTRYGMKREELEGYDALITSLRGCAIGVRTADCIPVLLFDRVNMAVAAIHAGWKGTVLRITEKTVEAMAIRFGSKAKDLSAVIGPGICRQCFQVGEEVVEKFREAGFNLQNIHSFHGERIAGDLSTGHHIDLKEANRQLLLSLGVEDRNIITSPDCTYEDLRLYSARRDSASTCRNINSIKIKS